MNIRYSFAVELAGIIHDSQPTFPGGSIAMNIEPQPCIGGNHDIEDSFNLAAGIAALIFAGEKLSSDQRFDSASFGLGKEICSDIRTVKEGGMGQAGYLESAFQMFCPQFLATLGANNPGNSADESGLTGPANGALQNHESLNQIASDQCLSGIFLYENTVIFLQVSEYLFNELWRHGFGIIGEGRTVTLAITGTERLRNDLIRMFGE